MRTSQSASSWLWAPPCPVEEMVEVAETRNRLRMLQPWLEARVATGSTEPGTHNALGKIYIQLNKDPKAFLTNNMFYEPKVLGPFCESLDPSLAFVAYTRRVLENVTMSLLRLVSPMDCTVTLRGTSSSVKIWSCGLRSLRRRRQLAKKV